MAVLGLKINKKSRFSNSRKNRGIQSLLHPAKYLLCKTNKVIFKSGSFFW
jgi:hypothetical protein